MARLAINPTKRLLQAMIRFATQREKDRVPRSALTWLTRPYTPAQDLVQSLLDVQVPEHFEEKPEEKRGYAGSYFLVADVISALEKYFPEAPEEESPFKKFMDSKLNSAS